MDLGIQGKRALVLASSRGIGFGIAQTLADEGAQVILVGRSRERLLDAAGRINARKSGTARPMVADLSQQESLDSLLAAVDDEVGGIDILVNNTGGPPAMPAAAITVEDLRAQFEAMVVPLVRITGHFLPGMRGRKWGRILTVASSGVVQPIVNLALSNALRTSLVGWSKTLSSEVAIDGVTANVILPGRIQTERVNQIDEHAAKQAGRTAGEVARDSQRAIPAGRYGTVDEFAAAAVFLVSGQASYITGSVVRVDGGLIRSV